MRTEDGGVRPARLSKALFASFPKRRNREDVGGEAGSYEKGQIWRGLGRPNPGWC